MAIGSLPVLRRRWKWFRPSRLVSSPVRGKGMPVEPPQDDLVLYLPGGCLRNPQNILFIRLPRGDLVLYHFLAPPCFHVPVAPLEVAGVVLAPLTLSLLLALLSACRVLACLLSVPHSSVRHKVTSAIGTLLRQRRPPPFFLVRPSILNHFFSGLGLRF